MIKWRIIEVRIDKINNHWSSYWQNEESSLKIFAFVLNMMKSLVVGDADNENEAVDDVDDQNQAVDDVDDENDTIPARINLYMMYPKNIKNKEPK